MAEKLPLHFVDPSSRARAELARFGFSLGHHCEVYGHVGELAKHPPRRGIILVHDSEGAVAGGGDDVIGTAMERLAALGVWLPLVAIGDGGRAAQIVAAIKAGALDYLVLPVDLAKLGHCLERIAAEAEAYAEARRRMIEARQRIANLSVREREVLDWLSAGSSNKSIARELAISPRTVEIHRANMMLKLGTRHAAEAVRLKLEARG